MNKVVLVLLALAVATASAVPVNKEFSDFMFGFADAATASSGDSLTCGSQLKCAGSGATCGLTGTSSTGLVGVDCNFGLFCDSTKSTNPVQGVCTPYFAIGADCSAFAGANDNNANFIPCGYNGLCLNNTCISVTFNQGLNQTCSETKNCEVGLSCLGDVCTKLPVTGEACSYYGCGDASECLAGKCVAFGTVAIGANCSATEDCVAGAYCSDISGTCKASFSSSKVSCSSNADCTNKEETCSCSNPGKSNSEECLAPQTYTSSQLSAVINLANCKNSKCSGGDNLCSACSSQICTAYHLAESFENSPGCALVTFLPCNPAASVVASIFLIIAALFVAL